MKLPPKEPLGRRLVKVFALAAAGFLLLFASIMAKGVFSNIITQLDNAVYSQFLATKLRLGQGKKKIPTDVVIVALDDKTLNKLGAYSPETYRRYHVDALEYLVSGNPAAVVYDILFADPHPDPDVDRRLAAAMKKGRVFAAHFATGAAGSPQGMFAPGAWPGLSDIADRCVAEDGFFPMPENIFHALSGFGVANAYPDTDGVLRKMPLFVNVDGRLFPTVSVMLYAALENLPRDRAAYKGRRILLGERQVPVDRDIRTRIPLVEGSYRVRTVSFSDVAAGRIPAKFFSGKVVFVAATATGLGDNKLLPVVGYVPGVKVHTSLFLGLQNGLFIREPFGVRYYLLVFLAAFLYSYYFYNKKEMSRLNRMIVYVRDAEFLQKFFQRLGRLPVIEVVYGWARRVFAESRVVRFCALLFRRTRARLETLIFQLFLLYILLLALFLLGGWFIPPTAFLIQVVIAYVMVAEYKGIEKELNQSRFSPGDTVEVEADADDFL